MRAFPLDHGPLNDPLYAELLRVPTLSVGHYRLPPGAADPQSPHTEDEVYVVLRGRALLQTESGTAVAEPGAILYVPAGEQHRFIEITELLEVIVVFGPAEHSLAPPR
ncbi:cupin domain-containing protein [Microbacterium sp. Marseille-Q6965]|uniref:cupin domain-containing protein n=1 Tax=Microbacterium sp. Marseille-Q6965 TaxID=2965072 RepID=UPI0021B77AF7|nr:cupin domain-containing protein [Microbacterium sp. Marseille-Q6965]